MKTTITKKIIALALSVFTMTATAQCPSIMGINASYGANGLVTLSTSLTNSVALNNPYFYYSAGNANQVSYNQLQFTTNGMQSVCVYYTDSLTNCSQQFCDSVTITNASGNSCVAAFNYYTDTLNCTTSFYNQSQVTDSSAVFVWNIAGFTANIAPIIQLSSGSYTVGLQIYSNNQLCGQIWNTVIINCGTNATVTPQPNCSNQFYYNTIDSANTCLTYFYNHTFNYNNVTSFMIDGTTYTVAPNQIAPIVALTTGYHNVLFTVYDTIGQVCDTAYQQIYVNCSGNNTVTPTCSANAGFNVFADSTNTGNYFAYNFSSGTGNVSYLWHFGDGTTSTQQYPFHNYATPGQYIICLDVTATSNSTTCADSQCDSSSVFKMASGFLMSQLNVIPQTVTGIKKQELLAGLNAYPNPIVDNLTIEFNTIDITNVTYSIYDAVGRVALTGNLDNSKNTVNTSGLQKGFYSLVIANQKGSALKTIKLVK